MGGNPTNAKDEDELEFHLGEHHLGTNDVHRDDQQDQIKEYSDSSMRIHNILLCLDTETSTFGVMNFIKKDPTRRQQHTYIRKVEIQTLADGIGKPI
jgi:hypothetical protein